MRWIALIQYGFYENGFFLPAHEYVAIDFEADNREKAEKYVNYVIGVRTAQYELARYEGLGPILFGTVAACSACAEELPENIVEIGEHLGKCRRCKEFVISTIRTIKFISELSVIIMPQY